MANSRASKNIIYSKGKTASKMASPQDKGMTYSAKKASAGKDIGKKGKTFSKIVKSASKKYGSKEAGKRVAGAILSKLRSKA